MYYCDSNLFIRPTISSEPKAERAARILRALVRGQIEGLTSSLTVDEVLWVTWKVAGKEKGTRAAEIVLSLPGLRVVDTKVSDVRRAIELVKKYDLKPRDAIHAACSLNHGVFTIISDDLDFDVMDELGRLGFKDVVLREKL